MYLTSDFITAVKRRAAVPTSQVTFTSVDFLQFGDEEIRSKMTPLVVKNLEEYWVALKDYPILRNQAFYDIPSRAVAAGLRDVQIVQDSDEQTRFGLDRLDPGDLYASYSGNYRFLVRKNGFYLQSNSVVIYPTPTQTLNKLRLSYICRPNSLVDVSACGLVQSIDFATNQVTLTATPDTFTTSSPLDFVQASPNFGWTAQDQTPTSVAGNVLTFATLPTNLLVGDYICLAGQTCVVQVPVELQPLLVQYVVVRVLSAQGDAQALQAAIAELTKLEDNAMLLIAPRVEGKLKRVVQSRGIGRFC